MYCDVLFEKFKGIDVSSGIECMIDNSQVLLKKENESFKFHATNKMKTSYLNGTKSAKFKHVDALLEDNSKILKSTDEAFNNAYNSVRLQLNKG